MADKTEKVTVDATVPRKRVRVLNRWNQLLTVRCSDGTERHLNSKSSVEMEESLVSNLMISMQTKGIISINTVK